MSLLMEALKKAEEAKRRASEQGPESPAATDLTLEPLTPPQAQATSPLPDLALHLATVDADLAAVPTDAPAKRRAASVAPPPQPGATPTADADAARSAARNAFAAKQADAPSRRLLWVALGIGGLAAAGIGAYFWWQLQGLSGSPLAVAERRPAPSAAPIAPLPPALPVAGQASAPLSAPSAALVSAPVSAPRPIPEAAAPPGAQSAPLFQPQPAARPASPPQAAKAAPADAAPDQMRPTPRNESAPRAALRLSRGNTPPPTVEQAYDALQAGRFEEAQRLYEQVLRSERKNTDALLGLATVAAQQGQNERAQAYYQQALEADPNDPTAQAGVLSTRGQADPMLSESRLKTALAAQPDAPALLFALGNLYARQQRWSEAQQAYFRAYSTEPDNPDFIFNLAVSLDQLRQARLAAQYYRMALDVSAAVPGRPVAFDRTAVRKRLGELPPATP